MKLSNKILIGFFGFVFLYMMAAFTEVRLRGYKRDLNGEEIQIEKAPLEDIGYIVLADFDHRVIISFSDEPRIEVKSIGGDYLSSIDYVMVGDTLRINAVDISTGKPAHVYVYVAKLRGLQVDRASVSITDLSQQTLSITQSGGSIRMDGEVNVTHLSFLASEEAQLDADNVHIDTLSVQMNHSNLRIWSAVKQLNGSITNESFFRIQAVDDIRFIKDKNSKLEIMD